jgi:plasmid stabilization system protein ParE
MNYQLKIKPLAEEDIQRAVDWYDLEQPDLADAFVIALDQQFSLLRRHPFLYAVRYRLVRVAPLARYPYIVCYQVQEETQTVTIEGVFHQKQDPSQWQSRS